VINLEAAKAVLKTGRPRRSLSQARVFCALRADGFAVWKKAKGCFMLSKEGKTLSAESLEELFHRAKNFDTIGERAAPWRGWTNRETWAIARYIKDNFPDIIFFYPGTLEDWVEHEIVGHNFLLFCVFSRVNWEEAFLFLETTNV
jgi:hypothetical protein